MAELAAVVVEAQHGLEMVHSVQAYQVKVSLAATV
jgi:hypothetical protein